jgi:hypothetical protein
VVQVQVAQELLAVQEQQVKVRLVVQGILRVLVL